MQADSNQRANDNRRQRFFAWPGGRLIREALGLGVAVSLFFAVVYGFADYITGQRVTRVPVDFAFERRIPFVAPMLVFYQSLYALCWLAPFTLRTGREYRALAKSMAVTIGIAGAGFLLCPAEVAFPPPDVPAAWVPWYEFADRVNLDYNLLPSLHVALAILCVDVYARGSAAGMQVILWAWGIAISVSTVLTHQHHLLDAATGLLLGLAVSRWVYPRWTTAGDTDVSGDTLAVADGHLRVEDGVPT